MPLEIPPAMPYLMDIDEDHVPVLNIEREVFDSDGPSFTYGLNRPNRGNEPLIIAISGTNTEVGNVDLNITVRIDDVYYAIPYTLAMDGVIHYIRIINPVTDALDCASTTVNSFAFTDWSWNPIKIKCKRFQVFIEPTSAVGTNPNVYIYVTWVQWRYHL